MVANNAQADDVRPASALLCLLLESVSGIPASFTAAGHAPEVHSHAVVELDRKSVV